MTRVYVPATLALLAEWHAAGTIPAGTVRVLAAAGDDESEYDALMTAAAESAALSAPGGRRVVVAADADATGPIAMPDVAAVHCDTADRGLDADPDDDLAWFATQEIPDLL
jgi:hypothetical protein